MNAKAAGYTRSYSGFLYAARRMGLCGGKAEKNLPANMTAVIQN